MITHPKSVNICECWARDGLQNQREVVDTGKKVEMIDLFTDLGFRKIEVTSFSNPKVVKQFADCMELLKRIKRKPGVSYVGLVPNMRGMDRLLEAQREGYGVDEVIVIISASEIHQKTNVGKNHPDSLADLGPIIAKALAARMKVIGCVGTVFGCPIAGDVPLGKVVELSDWYKKEGADTIMLGDTTGMANPVQVKRTLAELFEKVPGIPYIAHFHDTRGVGLANTFAAWEMGVDLHDSSLGGIGGQPATEKAAYHMGFTGNACTEDLVAMFEEMGVSTGIDVDRMLSVAREAERVVGGPSRSQVLRSGRVRHEPVEYKEAGGG